MILAAGISSYASKELSRRARYSVKLADWSGLLKDSRQIAQSVLTVNNFSAGKSRYLVRDGSCETLSCIENAPISFRRSAKQVPYL
jgi:hypothetical protein